LRAPFLKFHSSAIDVSDNVRASIKYEIVCECCGQNNPVPLTAAGSLYQCIYCEREFSIPPLSALKKNRQIDASPLGDMLSRIDRCDKPFDGTCQVCEMTAAPNLLPVRIDFVLKDDMVDPDEAAPSATVFIPCILCNFCLPRFQRGLWMGFARSVGQALLNGLWLVIAFIVAIIVAIILPLIGVPFVFFTVFGLFQHFMRRRVNPYLLEHLDEICNLKQMLDDAHSYRISISKTNRTN